MLEPSVTIVIPVHNRVLDTIECIESLTRIDYGNFEILVVDDGSTDNTSGLISEMFPTVKLLHGDGNLWWSGATNLGMIDAMSRGSDYVFLLNNDTVVERDSLSKLIESAERNRQSIIAPVIRYYAERDKVWFSGGVILSFWRGLTHRTHLEQESTRHDRLLHADWLTGMMVVKVEYLEDLGLMDETTFPQYWADSDFSLRARKRGYTLLVDQESVIYHKVDITSERSGTRRRELLRPGSLLFDVKSPVNICFVTRFFSRHFPSITMPILVFSFYQRWVRGVLIGH